MDFSYPFDDDMEPTPIADNFHHHHQPLPLPLPLPQQRGHQQGYGPGHAPGQSGRIESPSETLQTQVQTRVQTRVQTQFQAPVQTQALAAPPAIRTTHDMGAIAAIDIDIDVDSIGIDSIGIDTDIDIGIDMDIDIDTDTDDSDEDLQMQMQTQTLTQTQTQTTDTQEAIKVQDRQDRHVSNTSTSPSSSSSSPVVVTVISDPNHLVSDSDGGANDETTQEEEEDDHDDFHSATSHDAFHIAPEAMDVIFGRGQPLRDHAGNMRMRELIKQYTGEYRSANKQQKTKLIKQITLTIAGKKGTGTTSTGTTITTRFLVPYNTQEPTEGCKLATAAEIRGKISHGLRDAMKVEDLLDSDFVQLWATNHPNEPPPPPPHHGPTPTPTPTGGLMFQYQPSSFRSQTQQQLVHANRQNEHRLSMSSLPASFQNMPISMPTSPTTSGVQRQHSTVSGPAIYHVSINRTEKTDNDDDDETTLDSAEKGLSASSRRSHYIHPNGMPPAIAISAEVSPLRPSHGNSNDNIHNHNYNLSCWAKFYRLILGSAFVTIVMLVVLVIVSYSSKEGHSNKGLDPTSSPTTTTNGGIKNTLDEIVARGSLRCGFAHQEGYSARDPTSGRIEGFEVDLCRAVAAGIFGREKFGGDPAGEPVEFVFVEQRERFQALDREDVDILFAITTHNMERQVFEPTTRRGFSFTTPYLHNGLIFAGRPEFLPCVDDLNMTADAICSDTKICVIDGTTHKNIVKNILPTATIVDVPTFDVYHKVFRDGGCNILAGEQIDIFVAQQRHELLLSEDELQFGQQVHSKEPIAMVTRNDDVRFSDFCNWILQSLFAAEEVQGEGSSAKLSDLPTPDFFGENYNFMFHDAVAVVGDYGTIYERHLAKYFARSDANQVNVGATAAMFATPFGNLQPTIVPQTTGRTLEEIQQRGHLRCGITQSTIFAEFDAASGTWTGLDVSFCEAISAAIFDGAIHVRYTVLNPIDRFTALSTRRVDVLARVTTITMDRDIQEATSGQGFTFSPPNFHDEIHFAGVPPYHLCADSMDTSSDACKDLLVCVTSGTTQSERLKEVVASDHVLESSDTPENVERFVRGECNAIAGGVVDVAPANVANLGYTGPYEIGPTAYSRESLALVTREDDVTWSNFVHWVVIAPFYAEEQNITQKTFQQMPEVDLFKPVVNDELFRNVIRAVGSYAEIWERAAAGKGLKREGRNLLNALPLAPQLLSDLLWDKPSIR